MTRRALQWAGTLVVLLGVLLAALWVTRPRPVPVASGTGGEFVLAAPAPSTSPDAVEKMLKREIWGLPSAAYSRAAQDTARAAQAKPAEKWQLTSTYRVGTQSFVLLRRGDKSPEALKPGDALPDGAKIAEIQEGQVWVLADGKRTALKVPPR
jgi:hypothetical protein